MAAAPPPHVAATAEAAAAAAREAAERRRMYMKIWDAQSAIQIRNNLDELQRLIETEGVPIDSVYDGSGDTLLMLAIQYIRWDMIRYLLSKGANPNIKNARGETAVHKAAFLGNIKMLELLFDHGADLLAKNNAGDSPFDVARYAGHVDTAMFLHRYFQYRLQTKQKGRNLAALATGLTKGTKENASREPGLSNMPSNVLNRIGSYLSGKEGSLNEQRGMLRRNIGPVTVKPAGGAGDAPGGGGGGRNRRRTRRRRSRSYRK